MNTLTLRHDTARRSAQMGAALAPARGASAAGVRRTPAFRPQTPGLAETIRLLEAATVAGQPGCWGRAAPSAFAWQEIAIYAVLPQGAFRFDPRGRRLLPVPQADLRAAGRALEPAAAAPVSLVYVADLDA